MEKCSNVEVYKNRNVEMYTYKHADDGHAGKYKCTNVEMQQMCNT